MASDELDLDRGWCITETAFEAICEVLSRKRPRCIVEFGSGPSSIRLAQRFPGTEILSIEHDWEHLARIRRLAEPHLLGTSLWFSLRPLTWQRQLGGWFRSYRPGVFPQQVDAVIIDGPPFYCFRGREACFHQVVANLPVGAVVILDDYSRPAERLADTNWELAYPGQFQTQELRVGHALCVKQRIRIDRGRTHPRVVLENYLALSLHTTRWALRLNTYPPSS